MPSELVPIARGAIAAHDPTHLTIVMIAGWFGPKWLGFQGKVLGIAGAHNHPKNETPDGYSVPPFNPTRVVAEQRFHREPDRSWREQHSCDRLHISQTSERNLRRHLRSLVDARTLMIWHGATGDRASLMTYWVGAEDVQSWHVTMDSQSVPARAIGTRIRRDELDHLVRLGQLAHVRGPIDTGFGQ